MFLVLLMFCGIIESRVQGQNIARAGVFVIIERNANVAQIKYQSSILQSGSTFNSITNNTNNSLSGSNFLLNSNVMNFGSFTISTENKNSFSVSLPAHPVDFKNSESGKILQVSGSQMLSRPVNGVIEKNIRVVNLEGSLKTGSVNLDQSGVYTGTYPITFVYN